jgi:hypothetical protein
MEDQNFIKDEYEEAEVKCRNPKCKEILHGKNAKDVGYCLDCFNEMMADDEEE